MSKLRVWGLCGLVILAIGASNASTYWHTREKWRELGRMSGVTEGLAEAMKQLCKLESPGPYDESAEASIAVKAEVVTLKRKNGLVEIRCN
ncbi:hypothetical protein [Aliiroseovarius crassostreae]|uniref:hypothetical protein n=1 Tax=Aliiroseovarius crassostreae TaxID=154981 RepID=UPI003C7A5DA5